VPVGVSVVNDECCIEAAMTGKSVVTVESFLPPGKKMKKVEDKK